ncbi:MAG: phosphoadenylyl-sulfate reductase [Myxococcota bacterium]
MPTRSLRPRVSARSATLARPEAPTPILREGDCLQAELLLDLGCVNRRLTDAPAEAVVNWAARQFREGLVASTSFGIQSAVMLHLVSQAAPKTPIVWVDTGYLPPETYRYADELSRRLDLELRVYQSPLSPARMEALHGRLWESGDDASYELYDRLRKVEPMGRALQELGATAWLSGIRADQTHHRAGLSLVSRQGGRYKVSPILGWSSRDVFEYLRAHDLPRHPLFEQGFASVGDWHSSRALTAEDEHERDTRFQGRRQECGIHLELDDEEAASLDSSSL